MPVITIDYAPRAPFRPLHDSNKRWSVIVAHRRAGKTVACINHLIRAALTFKRQDGRFGYVAPFYRQSKAIAWDYLKRYSQPVPGIAINESELRIDYPNGSRIQLYGADNADALRGMFFDGLVADEFGDWKPSVWAYVIRPALADRQGWAIIIGTPKGKNQFWDTYQRAENDDSWLALTIKASTSGLLPADELASLKRELSDDAWRQEMECDFNAALPGAFYGRELWQLKEEGRICPVPYDPAIPVHTAWDLGFSDDTAIWWYQVVRGEIHVLKYFASSGETLDAYIKVIERQPYIYGKHWVPHDARAKTLASGGKSIEEQLRAAFGQSKVWIVPSLSIQDGIQAARKMLAFTWFDQGCEDGLEPLRQYQREWDEDKKSFKDKPRHDWTSHAADALRMLGVAWQQEAEKPTPEKAKFWQDLTINELWKHTERPRTNRI